MSPWRRPATEPALPDGAPTDVRSAAAGARARLRELLSRRGAFVILSCLLGAIILALAGDSVTQYLVSLDIDTERARLAMAVVLAMVTSLLGCLLWGRPGQTRLGAQIPLTGFAATSLLHEALVGAAPPPGIQSQPSILDWFIQVAVIVLLGAIFATLGAGCGMLVRRDGIEMLQRLRRRPRLFAVVLAIAVLIGALGVMGIPSAVQFGPSASLYNYRTEPASASGQLTALQIAGRRVDVYVPAPAAAAGHTLPVVYLLHGTPGAADDWEKAGHLAGLMDQLIAEHRIPPMLAVIPDGNATPVRDSEWADLPGNTAVESWLINQVIPGVQQNFRGLYLGCTGIAGMSTGAFGATNLALRHPDTFAWVGAYGGYFVADPSAFGSQAAAAANSPVLLAKTLPASQRMPMYLVTPADDDTFGPVTEAFDSELTALSWPHSAQVLDGGHAWSTWRLALMDNLEWVSDLLSRHAIPGCAGSGG